MEKTKLIVLRTFKYGESDLIVRGLTRDGGKVGLFARSALKSRKRFGGGVLEPTHYIEANIQSSSRVHEGAQLATLHEAHLIEGFHGLREQYQRLETALYFVHLVDKVAREGVEDSPQLFNILGNSLKVAQTAENLVSLKTHFEWKLLQLSGVLPRLEEAIPLNQTSILEHDQISMSESEWRRLENRTRGVLREFLGETGHDGPARF